MPRLQPLAAENQSSQSKELLAAIQKKMGKVPVVFQTMSHSSAMLEGYLNLNAAVEKTSLSPKLREKIALVVGETNNCNYCLAAHTAIGEKSGLRNEEMLQARQGQAEDSKTQAILKFAKAVVQKRGQVADADVNELRKEGVTDQEIVECVLVISINLLTNYFNHVADPTVDFPLAPSLS